MLRRTLDFEVVEKRGRERRNMTVRYRLHNGAACKILFPVIAFY